MKSAIAASPSTIRAAAFAAIAAATPGVRREDFPRHRLPPMTALAGLVAASAAAAQDGGAAAGLDWEELALAAAGRVLGLLADSPRPERRPSARDEKRIGRGGAADRGALCRTLCRSARWRHLAA